MHVPFLDLKANVGALRDEVLTALAEVVDTTAFAGGPVSDKFEEEFAAFTGAAEAVAVGSGTEALWLTLLGLGIGPGDEVITVPHTFIATAEAISFCGARPVFVDIDPVTYTLDPEQVAGAITVRTKAIIPVHLYGQPADMTPIRMLAAEHGLHVVEDACQAHGATYRHQRAGTLGDAGCFSFYPGKNLGAFGEGGAVTTNDAALAERLRQLRNHGQSAKNEHTLLGWNSRMDGFQAAVLRTKLRHLPEWTDRRRAIAAYYVDHMEASPAVVLPVEAGYASHVYHLFVVRVAERDDFMRYCNDHGVQCGVHYPKPVHLQKAYSHLGLARGMFPQAERAAAQVVSLPMYPEMTAAQAAHVANTVNAYAAERSDAVVDEAAYSI